MRPILVDIDPVDENLTGYASNVTGATFTLTANDSGDGLARRVTIRNDTINDHSGKTITLVGTDADGHPLTEVVTGPAGSATVTSTGYFLTLTSATPSATIGADTFDIGWADEVQTRTIPVDRLSANPASIGVTVTGTIAYSVYQTFDDIQAGGIYALQSALVKWFQITEFASKSASLYGAATLNANGLRLNVESYSSGAEIQLSIMQASGKF